MTYRSNATLWGHPGLLLHAFLCVIRLQRSWLAAIFHLSRTCTPPGLWGVQGRLWLIPPTPVTDSLRHSPLAGGCSPSGPKPHATTTFSSHPVLALSTRPGAPLDTDSLSSSRPTSYINVASSDLQRYINAQSVFIWDHVILLYICIYSIYSMQLALQLLIFWRFCICSYIAILNNTLHQLH